MQERNLFSDKSFWADLTLVLLLSGLIFASAHFQGLTNHYVINDDVRQQIYWMQQWRDPQLYQGDWLTGYARAYVSWGVKGVYLLASRLVEPLYFSKILPGFLFLLLAGCFYSIGRDLGGRVLAWSTVCVFWLMPVFLNNLSGGLARSFAAPLLALFGLCWLGRRGWAMGVVLLLQALFIPYIFILCACAAVMAWVAGRLGWPAPPFPLRPMHFCLLAASAAIVLLMYSNMSASGYGPLVSAADMAGHPEYSLAGRYPIIPAPSLLHEIIVNPWNRNAPFQGGGLVLGYGVSVLGLVLAGIGAVQADWRSFKARQIQPALFIALASGLVYLLARLFMFRLFVPSRYLEYTADLFYCLVFAIGLATILRSRRWPRLAAVAVLVLVAVVSGVRLHGVGLYDYSASQPLQAALDETPKNALIGGHPKLMDNVLTFSRRPVVASYELAHPWSKGLWQRQEPLLWDLFTAYYAADPEVVRAFCRKYRVDFLVVDDRDFSPEFLAGRPFFEPFDQQIRDLVHGQTRFALLGREVANPRFITEHWRILDVRSLRSQEGEKMLAETEPARPATLSLNSAAGRTGSFGTSDIIKRHLVDVGRIIAMLARSPRASYAQN